MTKPGPKGSTQGEKESRGMPTGVPSIITQPSITPTIPQPPKFLDRQAKRIWKSITISLHEMGMIGDIDQMMLSIICQTYADYVDCRVEISKLKHFYEQEYERMLQTALDNGEELNTVLPRNIFVREGMKGGKGDPLMRSANELATQIAKLTEKFGMTPASRSAIRLITKATEGIDPFSQFLDSK